MDIEELVKKHVEQWDESREQPSSLVRAALTELAAQYEKQITELQAMAINNGQQAVLLGDRVTQLEAELGGYLTVGGGHIVYGTAEALARVQAYILLDSKHPREERDTNRYFAKQLQAAEQHIKQLEAERVPDGWRIERDDDAIIVTKLGIGGCVVNRAPTAAREIPESILWELADSMLAAAPAAASTTDEWIDQNVSGNPILIQAMKNIAAPAKEVK